MKKKNLVSLTISLAFFTLATTGLLLYVKQKPHFVEMTHTIFGLLFITVAIFHIVNNWASLKTYMRDRNTGSIQKELIVSLVVVGTLIILSVTEVLEPVAEFGRIFAKQQKKHVLCCEITRTWLLHKVLIFGEDPMKTQNISGYQVSF